MRFSILVTVIYFCTATAYGRPLALDTVCYCKGTVEIKELEGDIEDGSSDAAYGISDCKWLITAPEGKHIEFSFTEFDTEARTDQVYIFNGTQTNHTILAMFSGPKIPPSVRTYGNAALIWFVTNDKVQGRGWKLHYKIVDDNTN